MSNLYASTSLIALHSTMPPVSDAVPDHIEARVLYNCFNPREVEIFNLDFREGLHLSDYLEGLPPEANWMVFFNGSEVALADADTIPVVKGDRIALLLIPQGGDTIKSIMRVVVMAAAVAIGTALGGPIGAVIGAVVATIVSTLLLQPKMKMPSSESDGQSYGIDGAKNSATENIPYPVVYGEFRCAGNFSDVYTENVGDDQYLYLRTIFNDGLIEGIYDEEVNEQPLANFANIQTEKRLGTPDQAPSPWFGRSIVQRNKAIKLTTAWTNHITSGPVDMVRFDLTFPQGLVDIDKKKGDHRNRSVTFEMRYRPLDPNTGQPTSDWLPFNNATPAVNPSNTFKGIGKLVLQVKAGAAGNGSTFTPAVEVRQVGTSTWSTLTALPTVEAAQDYMIEPSGYILGTTQRAYTRFDVEADVNHLDANAEYELRTTDGSMITSMVAYPRGGTGTGSVTDNKTRQIRRSFASDRMSREIYEVSIRRTTAQSTDDYIVDEVYLTDVAEIDCDPMTMRHTAYLGLRVKLDEQLNQIPQLTARVKGCILREYDINGNQVAFRWSANPAWIALDLLLSQERGAGLAKSRIDFPAFVALAEYCEANDITFNGVFDTATNLGDALRQVLRVGRALPVPFGTRISVAIDRPRQPVQMFNAANITGDFQVAYLAMNGRANEFEVSYFDKTDRNKQKSIRYVDPKAVAFNEVARPVTLQMIGIDNAEQAKEELWRMIYANRLIMRTLSFSAALESISMLVGDVALIHHPMMNWAYDGRIRSATINSVVLDQAVTVEAGKTYNILVRHDAARIGIFTVNSVVGNRILVSTNAAISETAAHRVKLGNGADYEVIRVEKGGVYDTLHLNEPPTGLAAGHTFDIYRLDYVEERTVASVTPNGANSVTVAVTQDFTQVPTPLAIYAMGEVTLVKKPYVLNGIQGDGIEKRTLTFTEYDEGVYAPPELDLPTPVARNSDRNVEQVRGLMFDYEKLSEANRKVVNCRVHWQSGHILNYAGADVYMSLNGSDERPIASAVDTSEVMVALSPNDDVSFRVVPKNRRGDRAPYGQAPTVEGKLTVVFSDLDAPTNFQQQTVNFEADGVSRFTWSPPADATGIEGYELEIKASGSSVWIGTGYHTVTQYDRAGLAPGAFDARVRSISSTSISPWTQLSFTVVAPAGSLLNLRPAEAGADVTGNNIADGIANQGPGATDPRGMDSLYLVQPNLIYDGGLRLRGQKWNGLVSQGGAWTVYSGPSEGYYASAGQTGTQLLYTDPIRIYPNASYVLAADMLRHLTVTGGEFWADVEWLNEAQNAIVGYSNRANCVPGDWQRKKVTIQAPSNAAFARVRIVSYGVTAFNGGVHAVKLIKLHAGDKEAPFSDDLTDSARYQSGQSLDALKPAQAGADVTSSNVASGIVNQTGWATYNGDAPATYQQRVQYLGTNGYLADLDRVSNRQITKLYRADNSTAITEAAVITNQGVASGIANQTGWATYAAFPPAAVTQPGANLIYDAGLTLQGQQWSLTGWSWGSAADIGYFVYAPGSNVNMQIGGRMAIYGGNPYTFSLYSGGDGYAGGGTMQLNFYDAADNFISQATGAGTVQGLGYVRTSVTAAAPANAAYARCYMASPTSLTGFFIVHRPKLEMGSAATIWTNEATYGARYQTGGNIDSLKPAEAGANITENRTADSFRNQTAWATYAGDSPAIYQARTQYLDSNTGYLSDLDRVLNRQITKLYRANNSTPITEVAVITDLGTADAIKNQAWAATNGTEALTSNANVTGFANACYDSEFNLPYSKCWDQSFASGGTWAFTGVQTWGEKRFLYRSSSNAPAGAQVNMGQSRSCQMPVVAGQRIEASAVVGATNLTSFQLQIGYYSASDQFLGYSVVANGNTDQRVNGLVDVPSLTNLAYARMLIVGFVNQANTFTELRFAAPYMRKLQPNTPLIAFSAYTPGPSTQPGSDVTAEGTAAAFTGQGQLATMSMAQLPLGSNYVVDSDFVRGTYGFGGPSGTVNGTFGVAAGVNLDSSWSGVRNVAWGRIIGTPASNVYADVLYTKGRWDGGTVADMKAFGMPVVQNQRVYARCLAARHRCTLTFYLLIFDKDGTLVEAPNWTGGRDGGGANGVPANFDPLGDVYTVGHPAAHTASLMWRLTGKGENDPFIFITEPAMGILPAGQTVMPPYQTGRLDPMGDQTSAQQVTYEIVTDKSINADYQGNITGDLASVIWSPKVYKGGVSIKVADSTTYSMSNGSGGTFVVNNTNGSSGKGDVSITSMTAQTAQADLNIYVDGLLKARITIKLVKNLGQAPAAGGGGGVTATVSWDYASTNSITGTSYIPLTNAEKTIPLTAGQKLTATASIDYYCTGTTYAVRTMTVKAQYSTDNTNWNDFGAGVTGSEAASASNGGPPDYEVSSATAGVVNFSQDKTGLAAGTYYVRFVALVNATGRSLNVQNGSLYVQAKT